MVLALLLGMVEGSSNSSGHTEIKYSSSVRQALGNRSSLTNRDVRSSSNSNSSSSSAHNNDLLTTNHLVIQHGDPGSNSTAGETQQTFKRNRLLLQALRWALSTYALGVGGMVTLLTSALRHPVSRATAGPVASMDTRAATALLLRVLRAPSSMPTSLYGGGAFSGDSSDGDSVSIDAVGGVDGRGDGTTGDATWVQQQDGGIYGLGGTVYASGGDGGYGMSALPSQSYQQQDASMIFPWASNDEAEFGGMRDGNGDEGKDAGDGGNGDGGTGGHRGGGLLS